MCEPGRGRSCLQLAGEEEEEGGEDEEEGAGEEREGQEEAILGQASRGVLAPWSITPEEWEGVDKGIIGQRGDVGAWSAIYFQCLTRPVWRKYLLNVENCYIFLIQKYRAEDKTPTMKVPSYPVLTIIK